VYDLVRPRPDEVIHQRVEVAQAAALQWLAERHSVKPVFLYVHGTDPHAPYLPPEPFRSRLAAAADPQLGLVSTLEQLASGQRPLGSGERENIISLYDGDVAYADHQFGLFVDALAARGLYRDALIILIADHGEAFADHASWQHGSSLFEEQIHVPLLIKLPGNCAAGTVVSDVAQQVDILPTVLDLAGVSPPAGLPGTSLVPAAVCGTPLPQDRPIYSQFGGAKFSLSLESVVVANYKLIHDFDARSIKLFDVAADPQETHDLAAERRLRSAYLASLAIPFRGAASAAPEREHAIDAATRERLRALGYGR